MKNQEWKECVIVSDLYILFDINVFVPEYPKSEQLFSLYSMYVSWVGKIEIVFLCMISLYITYSF